MAHVARRHSPAPTAGWRPGIGLRTADAAREDMRRCTISRAAAEEIGEHGPDRDGSVAWKPAYEGRTPTHGRGMPISNVLHRAAARLAFPDRALVVWIGVEPPPRSATASRRDQARQCARRAPCGAVVFWAASRGRGVRCEQANGAQHQRSTGVIQINQIRNSSGVVASPTGLLNPATGARLVPALLAHRCGCR